MSSYSNHPYLDKLHPSSSHNQIARRLQSLPPGARILDVGAASGTMGRLCQGRQLHFTGIEPEAGYAEWASPFYAEWVQTDLDHAPVEKLSDYQVVICADVLEHMPKPEESLRRLVSLQQAPTEFILSVPNIANLWVRLNLLFGRFEYSERGILDRTHLRFFTRETFLELVRSAGLQPLEIAVTPIPLELVHPFFLRSKTGSLLYSILVGITRLFPTLLGYQWICFARTR